MPLVAATVTVNWGYENHSLDLTPRRWAQVVAGKPVSMRGQGYHADGKFWWDYWAFNCDGEGSLNVGYGEGGEGWSGNLASARVELVQ
jgi:hypothetical protein